ncbi:MAG: hypothetical protein RIR26_2799 [Pseudomonadota bacterium]
MQSLGPSSDRAGGFNKNEVLVGVIKKSLRLASWSTLVLWPAMRASANPMPPAPSQILSQSTTAQKAAELVEQARALLANAIPEERSLAEQQLVEATRLCRNCPDAYAELGRLWLTEYTLGRAGLSALQRSVTMAELVKELAPESPLGEYLGVEVLLTIGRQSEAFKLYSATKEEFPNHTETLAFEARLWAEVEPAKALSAAQLALAKGYPLQDLAPWIGNALVKSVGEEKSGEALARFAEVYPDRWLWHRAAMSFAANKQWKEAKAAFLKAIALGNSLESPLQLAILEYRDLGMTKEACARLDALGKLVRESKTLGSDSQALVESHTAMAYLANKDRKLAKSHAEKALTLSVNNEARINQIVEAFKSVNQLSLIGDALLKTVSKNPLLEDVHLALALLATDAKNYPKTVEHLSAAIALAPDRDDLYSARGQASYLALQYEVALRDFETAIRQKPDHAPYHYNRACLLSLLGRKLEAYESLKTALFMNQNLRDQALSDSDLENLRLDKEYETRLAQIGIPSNLGFLKKPALPALHADEEKSSQNTTLRTRPGKPE